MISAAHATAGMLVVTVVMGAVVYYVVDMNGLDPLGLMKAGSPSDAAGAFMRRSSASAGAGEVQEEALEALVTALEKTETRGRSGDVIYQGRGAKVHKKKDAEAMYEELVLDELVTNRIKKQKRAKQHARETVAAVVEEIAQEVKRVKEGDEDDAPKQGNGGASNVTQEASGKNSTQK